MTGQEATRRGHVGVCQATGKRMFTSRGDAKRNARIAHPGTTLSAYRCSNCRSWHYGNLPPPVRKGILQRGASNRPAPAREQPWPCGELAPAGQTWPEHQQQCRTCGHTPF